MMRLVEVADLEKFIRENVCTIGDDNLLLVAGNDGRWNEALPLVKTAYDVDKVVEELKCDRCESCSLIEVCAGSKYCGKCHEKIIEIVKQGGVADDVCEWKLEDEESNLYLTGCQQRQLIFEGTPKENLYRYCPYCGNKIKVVE